MHCINKVLKIEACARFPKWTWQNAQVVYTNVMFSGEFVRNVHKWLLISVCTIAVFLMLISSSDPILPALENTFLSVILINQLSGNAILFNLSIGIIVSTIFYFIVVFLPERQKVKDVQPQIEQYISAILTRTYSLASETVKHSGKNYDLLAITSEEFLDVCTAVNPQSINKNFHNNDVNLFQQHYGYACANNWDFIIKNINNIMHFLPFVDTGMVKLLNEIRSSSFGLTVGGLKEIDKLKNTDMAAWAPCIFKVFTLGEELEKYYKAHINIKFQHPFKKT